MKSFKNILYFLILNIILKCECSLLETFKGIFVPYDETSNSSEHIINIVLNKRDVTATIEKRKSNTSDEIPICSDDQLMVYLAEIQAINPESIINLSTFENLYLLCKQVADSLDKMDGFLKTCRIPPEKDLYIQLIKGVDRLYDKICNPESQLRKDFEENFACLKNLHEDFETCFGPPDWTEESNKIAICKAYKEIAECYYIKAAKVCGTKAASVMKRLVKAVIEAIITQHCKFEINANLNDVTDSGNKHHFVLLPLMFMINYKIIN